MTNLAWDLEKGTQFVNSFSGDYRFNETVAAYIWDIGNQVLYVSLDIFLMHAPENIVNGVCNVLINKFQA